MLPANSMHLINPGDDPSVWVFHNALEHEGVCGFGFARGAQPPATACLLVSRELHTQKMLYQLCREGVLYERATSLLAVSALRPGDIVIDIGAHVGFFSTLCRLATGPDGAGFAFEPLPDTFRRLRDNLAINEFSNVLALPLALSDRSGSAVFHIDPNNEGESTLIVKPQAETCEVEVSTLDECFAAGFAQRPRLMKIDVEGVELRVLQGGKQFFADSAPDVVICELSRGALAADGASENALRDFFVARGYRCAVINNECSQGLALGGGRFYRYLHPDEASAVLGYPYVYNLLFVREGAGVFPHPVM